MSWIMLAAGAALSWGLYGASLHRGQTELGSPMRAMLCVGVAYFLMAVLVPAAALTSQGEWLGALGAVCITYAFRSGGTPFLVMPLVFGGAPLINVIASAVIHPPKAAPSPMLYVGFLLTAIGAGMVLYFRPPA